MLCSLALLSCSPALSSLAQRCLGDETSRACTTLAERNDLWMVELEDRLSRDELSLLVGRVTRIELQQRAQAHRAGCGRGDPEACWWYAFCLASDDLGCTQDVQASLALFEQLCEGAHPLGCASLADAYWFGRGVPRDQPRAVELYRTSCRAEAPHGCGALARYLWKHREAGLEEVTRLALRSCEREGSSRSCAYVGCLASMDGAELPEGHDATHYLDMACDPDQVQRVELALCVPGRGAAEHPCRSAVYP